MSDDDDAFDKAIDAIDDIAGLPPKVRDRLVRKLRRIERRRDEGRESDLLIHQQIGLAYGTLGAITLAVLVLIIQDPKPFIVANLHGFTPHQNFVVLILLLAGSGTLAILSTVVAAFSGSGMTDFEGAFTKFGFGIGFLGVLGFLYSLGLMVDDISPEGGNIFTVFVLVLLAIFLILLLDEFSESWSGRLLVKVRRALRVERRSPNT